MDFMGIGEIIEGIMEGLARRYPKEVYCPVCSKQMENPCDPFLLYWMCGPCGEVVLYVRDEEGEGQEDKDQDPQGGDI